MTRAPAVPTYLPRPVSHAAGPSTRAARLLLERLFAEFNTPILNYLFRLVGDPALAEDLAQESYTRAWRAREQLLKAENPRAWLYRIATNAARDHMRRARLLAWLPLSTPSPALSVAGPEDASLDSERMQRALLRLAPDYRVPLVLYTCQDFSVAEIAVSLGITPDAVKQRLVRARQQLREAYE